MTEQTFSVTGMKCANCKARVEGALKELAGVEKAVVNLKDANVKVTYDETMVSPWIMKDAVDDLGRFEMTV
jgi:copper chaperone